MAHYVFQTCSLNDLCKCACYLQPVCQQGIALHGRLSTQNGFFSRHWWNSEECLAGVLMSILRELEQENTQALQYLNHLTVVPLRILVSPE